MVSARIDVRHDAEHRDLEVGLDVLDGADGGVERLLHEGQHAAQHEPEERAHQDRVERLAADGRRRLGGRTTMVTSSTPSDSLISAS